MVYEGDAARAESVRPQLSLAGSVRADGGDPAPPAAARAREPASLPAPARLPVASAPVPPLPSAARRAHTTAARPAAAAAAAAAAPADPQSMYREYYAALRAGNHAFAIAGFRAFLERFPDHDYADNAQYWLGEAYYDQRDYRSALAEFRRVLERYPDGNKVPDALLKVGYCYLALGELGPGRDVLEQLVDIHPRSDAAALAARRLEELAKAKAKE